MSKLLGVGLVVVGVAVWCGAALAAEEEAVRAAHGTVLAVTPASKTIVVESSLSGQPWIIGVEVTDQTRFEGKAKDLADVKAGDKVTIQWIREGDRWVGRSITVW